MVVFTDVTIEGRLTIDELHDMRACFTEKLRGQPDLPEGRVGQGSHGRGGLPRFASKFPPNDIMVIYKAEHVYAGTRITLKVARTLGPGIRVTRYELSPVPAMVGI